MRTTLPTLRQTTRIRPFADNLEYLESMLGEYRLLLEGAALRRQLQLQKRHMVNEPSPGEWHINGAALAPAVPATDLRRQLRLVNRRLQALRRRNAQRLDASAGVKLPFRDMARRCGLEEFEQRVLWLLFFKAVSPEIRQQYEDTGLNKYGHELVQEIYIGNVLELLCPGSLASQLEAYRHFSTGAPLLAHHLVRFGRDVQDCISLLMVEVQLPQRVGAWISDDHHTYAIDSPFEIERPADQLAQVVLPQAQIDQVLRLIAHHEPYLQQRQALGLDRSITYGRAVTILEYGPPGTGKTLLARAVAHHTGRPLVLLNTQYAEKNSREQDHTEGLALLFREAQLQKGIVFIDECERLCTETSPLLRPLLIELEHTDALVIMATNRPDLLAPALDRRFTLKLGFGIPGASARQQIWQNHLEGVPLAPGVDLAYLSAAHPFSGGYIKNAVLTAVNAALSRSLEEGFQVTQEDLSTAAWQQLLHCGGIAGLAELRQPRFRVAESLLSSPERACLERLARIAANYQETLDLASAQHVPHPERGLKLLFHGPSYAAALRAAEALAGELRMPMSLISLPTVLGDGEHKEQEQSKAKIWDCRELFAAVAGTQHLLVFADEWGQLAGLPENDKAQEARGFFHQLSGFAGLAVVVTPCARLRLPGWAQVFQESLSLGALDLETRQAWWVALLGQEAQGMDVATLASRYPATPEGLQALVHRSRLLAATEGVGTPLREELIAAVAAERTGMSQEGRLFS